MSTSEALIGDKLKGTLEWGQQQAEKLYTGLTAPNVSAISGLHVLDVGCSWGYLLKFLADTAKPKQLIGTDVAPLWYEHDSMWNEPQYRDRIRFFQGDLPQIDAIRPGTIDLIICTSVLQYMTPEQVEANLDRMFDLLRPGGRIVLRTRVFTSYIGLDLHHHTDMPFPHLFYGEREIADHISAAGNSLRYLNWLTASSYAAIFVRIGFEIPLFKRRMNKQNPEVTERLKNRFPWIDENELLCAEVEAVLHRPIDASELRRIGEGLPHRSTTETSDSPTAPR